MRSGKTARRTMLFDIRTDSASRSLRRCPCTVGKEWHAACRHDSSPAMRRRPRSSKCAKWRWRRRSRRPSAPRAATRCATRRIRRHLRACALRVSRLRAASDFRDMLLARRDHPGRGSRKGLAGHLRDRGIRLLMVDHTRQDIGVAVARAVSLALQPFQQLFQRNAWLNHAATMRARIKQEDETPLF